MADFEARLKELLERVGSIHAGAVGLSQPHVGTQESTNALVFRGCWGDGIGLLAAALKKAKIDFAFERISREGNTPLFEIVLRRQLTLADLRTVTNLLPRIYVDYFWREWGKNAAHARWKFADPALEREIPRGEESIIYRLHDRLIDDLVSHVATAVKSKLAIPETKPLPRHPDSPETQERYFQDAVQYAPGFIVKRYSAAKVHRKHCPMPDATEDNVNHACQQMAAELRERVHETRQSVVARHRQSILSRVRSGDILGL